MSIFVHPVVRYCSWPCQDALCADDWCQTRTQEGEIWDLFENVKNTLCSEDSSFEKPWSNIDVNAITCPSGQSAIFPDNACTDMYSTILMR